MLTQEGVTHIWRIVAGESNDRIASVRVSSATDTATVDVQHTEVIPEAGGAILRVRAIFDERAANFEWLKREVVTRDGIVIDSNLEDGGRKVLGMVWDVEVDMNLAGVA